MAKKTVDWMRKQLEAMLQQFDHFTTKVSSYKTTFALTDAQVTASRNDYLWANYAVQQVNQFDAELSSRMTWRDKLLDGPVSNAAEQVPSIETGFVAPTVPAVADGILPRWRQLVEQIKAHPNYTETIGDDLGIEATEAPAQRMKPVIKCSQEPGGPVNLNIIKDGHDSIALHCKRNGETQPTLLGIYTRSRIADSRPNVVPDHPELREYTAQYRDGDVPVGDMSDPCRVSTKP